MTTTTVSQEAVEVTQADRHAAQAILDTWFNRSMIEMVLARHRHQAERETLARMEWRDIESAPKDWTDILVFSPEHEGFNCGGVFSAFYDTHEAYWFTHGPGHNIRLKPTHWMPLPPAPTQEARHD